MSDLNLPGEPDLATDGDLQSSGERLAEDVGAPPPGDDQPTPISTPIPPD